MKLTAHTKKGDHAYSSSTGWESLWCHYNGITARNYYGIVTSHLGNVFTMSDPFPALSKLTSIYNPFHTGAVVLKKVPIVIPTRRKKS